MTAEGEAEPPSAPSPAAGVNMLIQESWRMTFHFQNAETPLAVDAPHDPLFGVLGYSLSRLTPWKFPRSVTAGKYSSTIKKGKSCAPFLSFVEGLQVQDAENFWGLCAATSAECCPGEERGRCVETESIP